MSTISVIAKLQAKEGKRDDLVAAFREYFPQVEGEGGTLIYSVHEDTADDTVLWIFELYTDNEALSAHSSSDAFAAFGAGLGGILAGAPELNILNPVLATGHDL